ncbi:hypothetical protein [Moorena sp. SIO3A2]|uniref:hypothetical protein n=1 Tax=Moorena sp. SIO3A2 TaxID=2607841 RepID=UPI0013BC8A5D|nr:hypothetical protein [Moorena sp. SIO3A2]NER86580.1 hypothetical protein [Moorena sp. SIO3A2]
MGSFRENKKKRSRQLSAISLSATRTLREQLSAISYQLIRRSLCHRFPIPDSRFPIPDSRFPIPDSRFPITLF